MEKPVVDKNAPPAQGRPEQVPASAAEDGVVDGQSSSPALIERLRRQGLRPTRQRLALASLLFSGGDRHVTAEMLHGEALAQGERVSLATVYNTLHQFRRAGLLRELAVEGARTYFDTNTSNHNHFFLEERGELLDIEGTPIQVTGLPEPPQGWRISHIDVMVRLAPAGRRRSSSVPKVEPSGN